jgi:hypothetical protein
MNMNADSFEDRGATYSATKTKLRGFSPQANYTDRATAACREVSANFSW